MDEKLTTKSSAGSRCPPLPKYAAESCGQEKRGAIFAPGQNKKVSPNPGLHTHGRNVSFRKRNRCNSKLATENKAKESPLAEIIAGPRFVGTISCGNTMGECIQWVHGWESGEGLGVRSKCRLQVPWEARLTLDPSAWRASAGCILPIVLSSQNLSPGVRRRVYLIRSHCGDPRVCAADPTVLEG